MAGSERDTEGGTDTRRTAAIVGAATFVAGYVLFYLLKGDAIRRSFLEGSQRAAQFTGRTVSEIPPKTTLSGWGFYVAHNANLEYDYPDALATEIDVIHAQPDFLHAQDLLFWLIPVVVLLAGGAALVRRTHATTGMEGARRGASITYGYLPMAVLGVFVFTWSTEVAGATYTQRPHMLTALLMVGFVYPYTFGSLGGYLAGRSGAADEPGGPSAPTDDRGGQSAPTDEPTVDDSGRSPD